MFARLFLLFVLVPLADLVLLWILFVTIPWYLSLLLIVVTALLGAYFSRQQGLYVMHAIRGELGRNQLPANSLLDGVMVFMAGVLLITPGVLTDVAGFALLVPPFRRWLRGRLLEYLKQIVQVRAVKFTADFQQASADPRHRPGWPLSADQEGVVEGEVVQRDTNEPKSRQRLKDSPGKATG